MTTKAVDSIELHKKVPFGKWEIVDALFPSTPDTDCVIRHNLKPESPTDVHYEIIRQSTPGVVYEAFTKPGAKQWSTNFIVLRSAIASWNGRLLLSLLKTPIDFEAA